MPDSTPHPSSPPAHHRHPWARTVTILGVVALFLAAGLWLVRLFLVGAPGSAFDHGAKLVKEVGSQARQVAQAFTQGTLREEFLSRATELEGTSHLQVATLKQQETFRREEAGSTAWGLIPVPKVVVQAQAPVEYAYHLNLRGPWEFQQQDKKITVYPPPLEPNTPALDVSLLTFYTLEGSIWRDEGAVKERLRVSLSDSLRKRARNNVPLVREAARRQVAEFVEQWLGEKFGDGRDYQVRVVFPDERPATPVPENALSLPDSNRP